MALDTWLRPRATFDAGEDCWPMRRDADKLALFDFAVAVGTTIGADHSAARGSFVRGLADPRFDKLAEARNKSIHTPDGVGAHSITSVVSLPDLRALLDDTATSLFGSFGKEPTTYPYKALKDAIIEQLAP